jgi:hypothetical protein
MTLTVTTTAYYEGLNLSQMLKQIMFEIGQVMGTDVSYDKFPRWFIIQKLNDRLNKFVFHSQCIRKVAILTCKEGYKNYKLPINCMDGGIIGQPKFFSSADSYDELHIRDTQWLDENYQGWKTDSASSPQFSYLGESYGNIPMLGVYPAPDADGTLYTITPDTGVVTGGDLPLTTTNITGQATSGGATTLGDTTVDFTTLGLASGMTVKNVTDGSSSVIVTIAANTLTITTLAGGTANVFAAGDSYEILSGEYGVVTSWENDDVYIFSSEVGAIANITVPSGNILIDFIPYPMPFPETGGDLQYPEIPKLYHLDFAMGVVADLLGTFNEKTKEFNRAQFYEMKYQAAVALAKSKKESRPFNDKPVQFVPKRRGWSNK